jgi:membrane protein DedA with SNARE-associated domain
MNNRMVRLVLIVVGAIAVIVGLVWIGQGLGFIPGSVMTGDRMWFNIGLIVGLVGVIVLALGLRRPRADKKP